MKGTTPRSIGCTVAGAVAHSRCRRLPTDRLLTPGSVGEGPGRRRPMTERDDLPLDDYDHLPVGSLISRIRTLDTAGLQTLLDYERRHANRFQVVRAMESRLDGLQNGEQPSGGDPAASGADAPAPAEGGSKASTATTGPAINPPAHGDPTNPAQPR